MDSATKTADAGTLFTKDSRPPVYIKDGKPFFEITNGLRAQLCETLSPDTGPDFGKLASSFSDSTLEAIYIAANSGEKELINLAAYITFRGMDALIGKQIQHYGILKMKNGKINPDYEDFCQTAYEVIAKNINSYNPDRGSQIQSVLLNYLNAAFTEARSDTGGIKVPKHTNDTYNQVLPVIQILKQFGQESPSPEAIAAYYNRANPNKRPISPQTIANALAAKKRTETPASLDTEAQTAVQRSPDMSPVDLLIKEENIEELYEAIDEMPPERQHLVECLMAVYSMDPSSCRAATPYREVTRVYQNVYDRNVTEDWVKRNLHGVLADIKYKLSRSTARETISFNSYAATITIGEPERQENEDIVAAFLTSPEDFFGI